MVQPEELYHILHRKPFQPFRVFMKDGRIYDIRHQHLAMVGVDFFCIGIPEPKSTDPEPFYDYVDRVDLDDITRVETLAEAVAN